MRDLLALLPFLVAGLLGRQASRLARVLPPAAAVRGLTVAALAVALSCGYVLGLAAITLLARIPALARAGGWAPGVLGAGVPFPPLLGVLPAAAVVVLLARSLRQARRALRTLWRARVLCRELGPGRDGVVTVEDTHPVAYAVTGGRIVVSTAMAAVLPDDELAALISHERSHLRHRHTLWIAACRLAVAANPALGAVPGAVGYASERWADEDACRAHDRDTTARALARAGLAVLNSPRPEVPAAAHAARGDVVERLHALGRAAPPARRVVTLALVAAIGLTLTATTVTSRATEHRFETAAHAYSTATR